MKGTLRLLIGARDASLRVGLRDRLLLEPGIRVVGMAADLAGFMRLARGQPADVLIADASLAASESELVSALGPAPGAAVIVLSENPNERTETAGTVRRVARDAPIDELLEAIHAAVRD